MKISRELAVFLVTVLILTGCSMKLKNTVTVGRDAEAEDVQDFYYTYENINFNAFYQRYRIYAENGKHMFFHETRERKEEYGPATEKDTTKKGTLELSEEEWKTFVNLVNGGTGKKMP